MKQPLVINLFGGPGSGKSTFAAGLFYYLKCKGVNCELALEWIKEKVWEESFKTMDDQIYVFGKQGHRLERLRDKVDVIITDSPLLISIYYNKEKSDYFNNFVIERHNTFNNLNFFVTRGRDYQEEGRLQTLEESKKIDEELMKILKDNQIPFLVINREHDPEIMADYIIKEKLGK